MTNHPVNEQTASPARRIQLGVFLALLLVVGVPFWRIPYSSVNVPDAFYGPGLLLVFIAPLVLVRFRAASVRRALLLAGLTPAAALMLRVTVEGIQDPSRHNLWPIALVIVLALGFAVAAPGALLARLFANAVR